MVQSHRRGIPAWIERCIDTVRSWADEAGHAYEWVGDELLDLAPAKIRAKAGSVLPVTDAARLVLLADRLRAGHERVVWIDADVVVFAPDRLDVVVDAPLAVCDEIWVTGGHQGELLAVRLVNNSVLVATDPAPLDDLLAEALDIASRSDRLADRALGDRKSTRLNSSHLRTSRMPSSA